MLIRNKPTISENDVTARALYLQRRQFIKKGAAVAAGLLLPGLGQALSLPRFKAKAFDSGEELTQFEDATHYNNFYELGTGKSDPAENAHFLKTEPWSVVIDGEVAKPGKYALEDLIKGHTLEERIYRLRCVEAWSMVIPWIGFPLAELIKQFEPTSRAKYVQFTTLHDEKLLPGQRYQTIPWPYTEGLRMDEAMHPLTLVTVGMYGDVLQNQNGAPIRIIVPWKYGFKSPKSIVRITFSEQMPQTSWNRIAPHEYGFYSNVNPNVAHPRWNQDRERRIGEWSKRKTLMFNGYADQVASLYTGMDLKKWF